MELIFPLLILFMIGMLFVSSRQRKKQATQQEDLQSSLAVGDVVVMSSGISGTIVDTEDERTIDLEIAPDVVTTWLRAAVREKLVPDDDVPGADDIADDASELTGPDGRPHAEESKDAGADATSTTSTATDRGAATKGGTGASTDGTAASSTSDGTESVSSPRSS